MGSKYDHSFGELSINISNMCSMPTGIQVLTNTKLEHEHEITKALIIWNENRVFMYDISSGINVSKPSHIFELSHCWHVIQLDDFMLFLNKEGDLFTWNKKKFYNSSVSIVMAIDELLNDGPSDLSSKPIDPEKVMEGVLAMCHVTGNQICLLTVTGDDLALNLCSINSQDTASNSKSSFHKENHYFCQIASKSSKDAVETCLLTYIHYSEMNRNLPRQLCPGLSIEKSDIVIIAVGSGNIMSLSLTGMPSTQAPHLIYSSYHRAISIVYENETEQPCLSIVLSNNCMMCISSGQKRLAYKNHVCMSNYVVCQALPSIFLISDGNCSWQTNITRAGAKNIPLCIRGIYLACEYKEGKLLTITKHGAVHWISLPLNSKIQEDLNSCKTAVFIEHVRNISFEIMDLETAIEDEDDALKEMSLVKRLPYLCELVSIKVKVHDAADSTYNFEVQILNKSEISLTAKFWFVQTRLKGHNIDISQTHSLLVNFKKNDIIRIVSKCRIKKLVFPLILECRLINMFNLTEYDACVMNDCKRLHYSLLLGSVTLDISYFCTPISSAENVQEYTQDEFGDNKQQYLHTVTNSLKDSTSLETVAQILSKQCAHRGMNALRNTSNLSLGVGSSRIDITMQENEATFSSCNKQYLIQVQDYLGEKKSDIIGEEAANVDVDPMVLLEAQAARLGLDFIDVKNLAGRKESDAALLYDALRKNVIFPLPLQF